MADVKTTGATDEQIRIASVGLAEFWEGVEFDQTDESFLESVEEVAPYLVPPDTRIIALADLEWAVSVLWEDGYPSAGEERFERMRALIGGES